MEGSGVESMADIILVEDEEVLRRTLARTLEHEGHSVRAAESAEAALEALVAGPPDLLLTDQRLPGIAGHQLLVKVKEAHPDLPVVLLTAHGTIEDAVSAMRDGAADYLRKPIDLKELSLVVNRCLEREGLRKELDYYRARDFGDTEISGVVGNSPAIRQLRSLIGRLAKLEKRDGVGPTILLNGETGTGKGLTARAIHKASARGTFPFIEVNCTAIPDNLLEAELMGYEKGAFTDASQAKAGLLEAAEGGTIFFDEIGHMSKPLQAKILKVIDERVVRRLGSTRDRQARCTIVTATHMNLEEMVAAGDFLNDLYHRINVVKIEIPPLRDRDEDVLTLADYFLQMHAGEYGIDPIPRLTPSAAAAIRSYNWPGNIRELSHAVERALVMNPGDAIDDHHLALQSDIGGLQRMNVTRVDDLEVDFTQGAIRLEDVEIGLIKRAMEFTRGNQVRSAKLLGLSRDALRYRLEKYKLR
jgi:two-component system response regulator AtoC